MSLSSCQVCEQRLITDGTLVAVTVMVPHSGGHLSPYSFVACPKCYERIKICQYVRVQEIAQAIADDSVEGIDFSLLDDGTPDLPGKRFTR